MTKATIPLAPRLAKLGQVLEEGVGALLGYLSHDHGHRGRGRRDRRATVHRDPGNRDGGPAGFDSRNLHIHRRHFPDRSGRRRTYDPADIKTAERLPGNRRTAEHERTRREFQAAQDAARTAASRLQSATQAMSTIDPSVARQAAAQARRRATFSHTPVPGYKRISTVPPGCDCDAQHQCAAHAEIDRKAARRPRPIRRPR